MKLVEILLDRGLMSAAQLRSLAGIQTMDDDALGVVLVEEGLLTSDQLAQALGLKFGVPPALDADYARSDPALRKRMRSHQAATFRAIPLYTTASRRVAVAMVDPTNLKTLDDVGFLLGAGIEPMATSDLVHSQQLEKLYSMPRRRTTGFHPIAVAPGLGGDLGAASDPVPVLPIAVSDEAFESSPTPTVRRPSGNRWQKTTQSYMGVATDLPLFVPNAGVAPAAPIQPLTDHAIQTPIPPRVAVTGADMAVEQILAAPDRQAVADQLFAFLRSSFGTGAMFVVAGVLAEGRFGYHQGVARPAMEGLVFSLSLPSCFHDSYVRQVVFHGEPTPDGDPVHKPLWKALGCDRPREVLVAPVVTQDHVSLLLYAHAHNNARIEKLAVARMEHVCQALARTLVRLAG